MPRGILLVQSRPASADDAAEYHRWYEDTHLPEMLGIDGISGARRIESVDGGSFVAVYEIDDIDRAQAALAVARSSGAMTRPSGIQLDPPPSVQWFRTVVDTTA